MKRFSLSTLAVAGLLLTACSDKDVIAEGGSQGEMISDGYVALNINLPTTSSSTRAANDQFDDGLAGEYRVQDCLLLLFQGSSESTATLFSAKDINWDDYYEKGDADNDNITTSYRAVSEVSGYNKTNTLYALAMLNYKDRGITLGDNNTVTIGGSSITKLSDFRNAKIANTTSDLITKNSTKNYFFMTNAVLSKVEGGTASTAPTAAAIFQLAELDGAKIFTSADEAKKKPAGEIVVERAVAKATLRSSVTTVTDVVDSEGATITLDIAENGITWVIDNMEPETYVVRNPGDLSYIGYSSNKFSPANYRFVGSIPTQNNTSLGTTEKYYRTYWCIDPQYSGDGQATDMLLGGEQFSATGYENPLYCFENTFDVAHQTFQNTTRGIIKVTLADTQDFYTINGQPIYYTANDVKSHIITNIMSNANLRKVIQESVTEENSSGTFDETFFNNNFDITYSEGAGLYTVTELTVKEGSTSTFKTDTETTTALANALNAAKEAVNTELVILKYENGEMYYEARFMHFASTTESEDLAPWGGWELDPHKPTAENAYPGASTEDKEKNYLGRYGMVRNNWYDVEVTAFTSLGSPVNPSGSFDKPGTPDDHLENNIAVKIHVLSWAKRGQQWSF